MENIKKGTFVVEYVGEIITSEEAEERGKKYGKRYQNRDRDLDFCFCNDGDIRYWEIAIGDRLEEQAHICK